jgi:predicted patatin/cPLA2 family phospholipase
VIFDEKSTNTLEDLTSAIIASSSIPFVFPNRHFKGMTMMDGGTAWNDNLITAVNKCLEIVDDESQIIVDIILCTEVHKTSFNRTNSAVENYMRTQDMKSYY